MGKCKHQRCSKAMRRGYNGYCTNHGTDSTNTQKNKGNKTKNKTPKEVIETITIQQNLAETAREFFQAKKSSAARYFDYADSPEAIVFLENLNKTVMDQVHKKMPECKQELLSPPGTFVCAPGNPGPRGKASGVIHRDVENAKKTSKKRSNSNTYSHFPLTCLLCVTEVTQDNGAIAIWPGSSVRQLDPKQRTRAVQDLPCRILEGPAGTVFVFSSNILHKSLTNSTLQDRITLQWFVIHPNWHPIPQADYESFLCQRNTIENKK